jgi:hypothetical protein
MFTQPLALPGGGCSTEQRSVCSGQLLGHVSPGAVCEPSRSVSRIAPRVTSRVRACPVSLCVEVRKGRRTVAFLSPCTVRDATV